MDFKIIDHQIDAFKYSLKYYHIKKYQYLYPDLGFTQDNLYLLWTHLSNDELYQLCGCKKNTEADRFIRIINSNLRSNHYGINWLYGDDFITQYLKLPEEKRRQLVDYSNSF